MAENDSLQLQKVLKNFLLPILGVGETIATKGTSPGTVAMRQQQILQSAEDRRLQQEQAARQRAMQEKLFGFKERGINLREKAQASQEAIKRMLGKDIDPEDLAPEERAFFNAGDVATALKMRGQRRRTNLSLEGRQGLAEQAAARAEKVRKENEARKTRERLEQEKNRKLRLTGQEQKDVGAVEGAVQDLNNIVDRFNEGDFNTIGSAFKGVAATIPFFGQRIAPDEAGFLKWKKVTSERWLRIATGAAAPDKEVATYMGFLPSFGDTNETAQDALDAFKAAVRARAVSAAGRMKAEGQAIEAAELIKNIDLQLSQVRNIGGPGTPAAPSTNAPIQGYEILSVEDE